MWVKLLSRVWLFVTLWTIAYQAPLTIVFSRQEYWSGLPFPSPGYLPDPEIELGSPALKADAFTVWASREAPIFFSNSHIQMWELDHKKCWVPKNSFFRTVLLEKTLESPLVCKEIKPNSPKGNQPWLFNGRTDSEVEAPILWPLYVKSPLIGKALDAGKDWRLKEKGWQRKRS